MGRPIDFKDGHQSTDQRFELITIDAHILQPVIRGRGIEELFLSGVNVSYIWLCHMYLCPAPSHIGQANINGKT